MMGWLASLAANVGASEAGLALIFGQMLGYPVMLFFRRYVSNQSTTLQHTYFFLTGLLAAYWVIGGDLVHSLYAIIATYVILVCAGGTLTSVLVSFIFNFGYLLVGYYFTESEGYDICWTMPHCVLSLRLIGISFDCYDGERAKQKGESVLSKDQQQSALLELPTLLEMLSHSFFIGGYFVGPQFPMKKYRSFVRPDYVDSLPSSPLPYALNRFSLGLCYMLIHIVGAIFLPSDWPATDEFYNHSFLIRLLLLPLWCRVILAKYLFAWLSAEGVCILSGLAFNGVHENGFVDWKGCANVKVKRLETSVKFGNIIESFNINTNHWVATYIYKRLKFLGNRTLSQVVTLFFLAVWHGSHTGYYLTFANEFITIKVEREFLGIWNKSEKVEKWMKDPMYSKLSEFCGWLCVSLLLPHCFISFSLLTYSKFLKGYANTYFLLYVLFLFWTFFGYDYAKKILGGPKIEKKVEIVKPTMERINEEVEMVEENGESRNGESQPIVLKEDGRGDSVQNKDEGDSTSEAKSFEETLEVKKDI
jgi:lysophospholipid acyltransferase 5